MQPPRLQRLDAITTHQVYVLRLDEIHPQISGNKWFKLKYNIEEALQQGASSVLTFGGAYSNHIAATAAACYEKGIASIGIIRGEEVLPLNPTLTRAKAQGMELHFVSREEYKQRHDATYLSNLRLKFSKAYVIPEGGTNALAVKGTEEIVALIPMSFDYVCCAVGTGGTLAGLINAARPDQRVVGVAALKGDFLRADVEKWVSATDRKYDILDHYHFGGYAKVTPELIVFINQFHQQYSIPLDPIYTGKTLFAVLDMIKLGYFAPGKTIVVIHTGGLQGNEGFNQRFPQHPII